MASGYSDMSEITKSRHAYGLHQKPPKINLLNEQPRRESLVEQQLQTNIVRPTFNPQQQVGLSNPQQQQHQQTYGTLQGSQYSIASPSHYASNGNNFNISYNGNTAQSQLQPQYQSASYQDDNFNILSELGSISQGGGSFMNNAGNQSMKTVTTTVKTTSTQNQLLDPVYTSLVSELEERDAKLKREVAYMNQYHLNPWSRPRQIREPRTEPAPKVVRSDQRWVRECPSVPTSRPTSRASSTRSNTEADLMEKAARLLKDAEDLEKKPLKTQQIMIESGARSSRSPNETTSPPSGPSSVHTAVIKVPRGEINNKSPLPFSYDNFSTLGVRGNIASVGAAEPEKPYAPIFPIVKRTPSPSGRRG